MNCARIRTVASLALGIASLAAIAAAAAPEGREGRARTVTGWRGDGRGLYPEAGPPLTWSREAVDSVVKSLHCRADRPKGDDPAGATAIPEGHVRCWLVVGPLPADGDGDLETDYLGGEASIRPTAGDKVGELAWESVELMSDAKRNEKHFWTPSQAGGYALRLRGGKGRIRYAHSHVHAARAGRAVLRLSHSGGLKVWLNGSEIYKSAKPAGSTGGARNAMRRGDHRRYRRPGRGPLVKLQLRQGWNRLLLKAHGGSAATVYFADREDIRYRTRNIRWVARLPDWGVSSPIVVGDRVFVSSEPDILVCLDKKTGKVLWSRSTPIYAAVTEAERKEHPELKRIDPLARQLEDPKTDYDRKVALRREVLAILHKVDPKRYAWPRSKSHPASGFTFPTAASDGEHVYVFYTTSVAACYDLDGNRKWIRNMIQELTAVPSHPGSVNTCFNVSAPILVGEKLILLRNYLAALDKNTGQLLWKAPQLHGHSVDKFHDRKELKSRYNANFSATPTGCKIGGEDMIVCGLAAVVRAKDGKLLLPGTTKVRNPRAGFVWDGKNDVWLSGAKALHFAGKPETGGIAGCTGISTHYRAYAAPLFHDGLVYEISLRGIFFVIDAKTRALVYERRPDLEPWFSSWAFGCCSSPTLGGQHVYIMDNQLNTIVIKPGRKFEQVARNSIDNFLPRHDAERQQDSPMTNPVFDGDCIYVRGERDLFCIGPTE